MSRRNRRNYLTTRDGRVLAFVHRYRAVTDTMLRKAVFAADATDENVARVVRRLIRTGLLNRYTYHQGQSYLSLTRRGCRELSVPAQVTRPFTEQSLPPILAIAAYCVQQECERFTDREFRDRYPDLWRSGLRSSSYYLTSSPAGTVLAMFIVDRGATPRRIKGKLHRLLKQRLRLPAFAALIKCHRFRFTILVGTILQKSRLEQELKRRVWHHVEIEVAVVEEIANWLMLE